MAEIHMDCGLREKPQASEKFTACQPPCPVCELCGTLGDLKICAGCKDAWYCSKDHQRSHWPEHKSRCKKSRTCECSTTTTNSNSAEAGSSVNAAASSSPRINSVRADGVKSSNSGVKNSLADSRSRNEGSTTTSTEGGLHDDEAALVKDNVTSHTAELQETVGNTSPSPVISSSEEGAVGGSLSTAENQGNPDSQTSPTPEMILKKTGHTATAGKKSCMGKAGTKKGRGSKSKQRRDSDGRNPVASGGVDPGPQTSMPGSDKSNEGLSDYVVNCLTEYGICVVDQFLGESRGTSILEEVISVREKGCLKDGQLIANLGTQRKVRGDEITWVEKGDAGQDNISFLIQRLDTLIVACNSKFRKNEIGGRTKAMVACYPGNGTYYLRHVDNPNGDGRLITCIYYLNKNWDVERDGGILRIFPESVKNSWVADIEPKFDRLLFFWSDRRNPHEVQAAYKKRFAITVWYFDRDERQQALTKYQTSDGDDTQQQDARTMSTALVPP